MVMRVAPRVLSWSAVFLLGMLTAGCGSASGGRAVVRGKVSYKGVALGTGVIVFSPDPGHGGNGPLASAPIQTDGGYELRTDETPGVPAGWYRVTVVAVEAPAQTPSPRGFAVPRSLLPEKYRDPELSGLTCEVRGGRENTINFNLE
jgi:hypothetical protein